MKEETLLDFMQFADPRFKGPAYIDNEICYKGLLITERKYRTGKRRYLFNDPMFHQPTEGFFTKEQLVKALYKYERSKNWELVKRFL